MPGRTPLSLKGRALLWLSQREHSRSELRDKLLRLQQRQARQNASAEQDGTLRPGDANVGVDVGDGIEHLLDWLDRNGYLSDERFIESRLNVRAARYGNRRLEQELARHGLAVNAEQRQALRDSEFSRAQSAWARRFGQPPGDLAERARQTRFLMQRGFSPDTVRQVIGEAGAADVDDPPQ